MFSLLFLKGVLKLVNIFLQNKKIQNKLENIATNVYGSPS